MAFHFLKGFYMEPTLREKHFIPTEGQIKGSRFNFTDVGYLCLALAGLASDIA